MLLESDLEINVKKFVAGVVVLYNPEPNIIDNINTYLDQIEYLFIIDNSEDFNHIVSDFFMSNHKIEYIFNGKNVGIAEALNMGAGKAIEKGFLFLLTMDQDSKAPSDLVENLLIVFSNFERVGVVSPLHSNKYGTHLNKSKGYCKVMNVMASGNLLSLDAYKAIGGFWDELFIDYVDIEYCIRLNYRNYQVIQLNDVILEHNEANLCEKKIFSHKFYPTNNSPIRLYYKTRNLLYLREKYKKVFQCPLKVEYNAYVRNVIKIILFEEEKYLKIKMILLGITDYLKGKKGRKF